MAANLGSLVATITANTKPFSRGMKTAGGDLKKVQAAGSKFNMGGMQKKFSAAGLAAKGFSKVMGSIKFAVAGLAAKAFSKSIGAIKGQMAELDQLGKTSDKLGIGVQQLGQLRFAAEKSGVATGTLDMALQRMVRRVSEASRGTGEAVGAIKELGLSARELAGQTPDEQMRTLADAMKKVKSPADRVRLAMKLFDSEGVALVNMLKNGSGALDEQGEAFDRLHGKLSRHDVAKIEAANDAWADLKIAIKGAWAQFTVAIAPVIRMTAKFITSLVKMGAAFARIFGGGDKQSSALADKKRKADLKIAQQQALAADQLQKQLAKEKLLVAEKKKQAAVMKRQGEAITTQFMDPAEKLTARVNDLNRLVAAGAISWQTYNRGVAGAVKDLKEANKQTDKLAKRKAVGIVTRGSTGGFSAVQAARRETAFQRQLAQQQIQEQEKTNEILARIDLKTEPTRVAAVKI